MCGRPELGEQHIIESRPICGGGIGLLTGGVPELEIPEGEITTRSGHEARPDRQSRKDFFPESPLGLAGGEQIQLLPSDQIHPIRPVEAVPVERRMIEEDTAEVIGEEDIRVQHHPPSPILEIP